MAAVGPWATYHQAGATAVQPYPTTTMEIPLDPPPPPPSPASAPRLSDGYPTCGDYMVIWQVCERGLWTDFTKEWCWRLELGHRAGQICVESLRRDRLQFHFNLKFMYQENTTGTARRRIRRTLWYGPEMDAHPCNKRAVQSFSKLYLGPPPAPREASLEQEGSESQSAARGDQPDNEADESNVWDS